MINKSRSASERQNSYKLILDCQILQNESEWLYLLVRLQYVVLKDKHFFIFVHK